MHLLFLNSLAASTGHSGDSETKGKRDMEPLGEPLQPHQGDEGRDQEDKRHQRGATHLLPGATRGEATAQQLEDPVGLQNIL